MRVAFMGTPDFAAVCLDGLIKADFVEVVAVVTQPDRQRGRGQRVQFTPVKTLAVKADLTVYQPKNVNHADFVNKLATMNLDAIIVVAYGQLLKDELLNMTSHGCINVHASLLPRYRGAGPIHRAILDGETKTGITTMYMDPGWDTGDMILQREIPIGSKMTVGELHDALAELGSEVLVETLKQIEQGTAPRTAQDHEQANYAYKIKKEEGEIDWTRPASKLYNLVRGMNPWPGAYTYYQGDLLKVYATEVAETDSTGEPGMVLEIDAKKGVRVQAGQGSLYLIEIQPANGKRMPMTAYLNGHEINKGEVFGDAQ